MNGPPERVRSHAQATLDPGLLAQCRRAQVIRDFFGGQAVDHQVPGGAGLGGTAQAPEFNMDFIVRILNPIDEVDPLVADALLDAARDRVSGAKQRIGLGPSRLHLGARIQQLGRMPRIDLVADQMLEGSSREAHVTLRSMARLTKPQRAVKEHRGPD